MPPSPRVRIVARGMVPAALLFFPLASLGIVLALARSAPPAERALLAFAAVLLLGAALTSPVAPVNDPWTHYQHLRAALEDPRRLLDQWDRPGFTLLAAGPAAFGIQAARIAAIGTALLALAATMRAARALGLSRTWLVGAAMIGQYDFFGQGTSTMTELPFAAALAVAILGWAEDRPWVVAAGLGWMGITRPEGPAFVALGALAILARWRRARPALASGVPLVLYAIAGSTAFWDARWVIHANPYRSLVSLRLELSALPRSFFFPAVLQSQGPALALLEAFGAALAGMGPARRLRFALAPVALSFVILTFLRIGPTDAWRESRYLVAIAPALALLAAAALQVALLRAPRAAPPIVLAAAALGGAWMTCWHWGQIGARSSGLLQAMAVGALALAALLWMLRPAIPPAAAFAALLVLPLVSAPPGVLSRHRAEVPPGAARPAAAGIPAHQAGRPARHDAVEHVLLGRTASTAVAVAGLGSARASVTPGLRHRRSSESPGAAAGASPPRSAAARPSR